MAKDAIHDGFFIAAFVSSGDSKVFSAFKLQIFLLRVNKMKFWNCAQNVDEWASDAKNLKKKKI